MSAQETFEATEAQQERIHNEIKESQSLISPLLPLSSLKRDFEGHEVYLNKLKIIMEKYKGLRRVRGDGNCFYRSFCFSYLENMIMKNKPDSYNLLKERCTKYKDYLISNGYTSFTVEDFADQFIEMIDNISKSGKLTELEEIFNNQGYSDYYIVFIRLIVSSYLQMNSEEYQAFIDEGMNMKQFCEREVEPMYVESDNIHITAISRALNCTIFVENCQNTGEVNCLKFCPDDSEEGGDSDNVIDPVILLYRPGHYDILYL